MISKFSLILSQNVSCSTKITVCELCENGESMFQKFIDEVNFSGSYSNELAGAIKCLEHAADLIRLPKNKFRQIEGVSVKCKVYEAKYGSIRIYHFEEKYTGRIIVIGGYKVNQNKDIKKVERIIKEYQNEANK